LPGVIPWSPLSDHRTSAASGLSNKTSLKIDQQGSSSSSRSIVVQSRDFVALKFSTQDIHRVIVSRIHTRHVYHAKAITKGPILRSHAA